MVEKQNTWTRNEFHDYKKKNALYLESQTLYVQEESGGTVAVNIGHPDYYESECSLTRDQSRVLGEALIKFAETGELGVGGFEEYKEPKQDVYYGPQTLDQYETEKIMLAIFSQWERCLMTDPTEIKFDFGGKEEERTDQ